jgi:hypothetical protein
MSPLSGAQYTHMYMNLNKKIFKIKYINGLGLRDKKKIKQYLTKVGCACKYNNNNNTINYT